MKLFFVISFNLVLILGFFLFAQQNNKDFIYLPPETPKNRPSNKATYDKLLSFLQKQKTMDVIKCGTIFYLRFEKILTQYDAQ